VKGEDLASERDWRVGLAVETFGGDDEVRVMGSSQLRRGVLLEAVGLMGRIKVVTSKGAVFPWDQLGSPSTLQVLVRRLLNWGFNAEGDNLGFPKEPEQGAESEIATLMPYGSTRLRLTVFPLAQSTGK